MSAIMVMVENEIAYKAGTVGAILLMGAYFKLKPHLPHRHTGYVSINGTVWNCAVCDRPPKDLERQLAEVVADAAEHPWIYLSPEARKVRDGAQ